MSKYSHEEPHNALKRSVEDITSEQWNMEQIPVPQQDEGESCGYRMLSNLSRVTKGQEIRRGREKEHNRLYYYLEIAQTLKDNQIKRNQKRKQKRKRKEEEEKEGEVEQEEIEEEQRQQRQKRSKGDNTENKKRKRGRQEDKQQGEDLSRVDRLSAAGTHHPTSRGRSVGSTHPARSAVDEGSISSPSCARNCRSVSASWLCDRVSAPCGTGVPLSFLCSKCLVPWSNSEPAGVPRPLQASFRRSCRSTSSLQTVSVRSLLSSYSHQFACDSGISGFLLLNRAYSTRGNWLRSYTPGGSQTLCRSCRTYALCSSRLLITSATTNLVGFNWPVSPEGGGSSSARPEDPDAPSPRGLLLPASCCPDDEGAARSTLAA